MAQPLAFSAVAALLTAGLLALSRESQELLQSETSTAGPSPEADAVDPSSKADAVDPSSKADAVDPSSKADAVDPSAETDDRPLPGVSEHERPANGSGIEPAAGPAETVPETEVVGPPAQETTEPTSGTTPPADGQPEIELTPRVVIANVAATQGLVAGIILAAGWYFAIPVDAFGVTSDPFSTGLPAVSLGVGFGVVLWLGNELSTTIADAVGAAYDEGVRELLAPDSPGGWALLFGVVLPLIAVGEELLFRAALIGVPAASFEVSPWLLAVVASLAFALGHGAQGRVGVVVTGLLGFVLAAGYIVSGSLLVVVVAHYVINALEFLVHEYLGIDPFENVL